MGSTDSELIFQWLLRLMPEFGLSPDQPAPDVEPVASLLENVVLDLVRLSSRVRGVELPKLNLLLSDGSILAASRWGNTLYWTERQGVRDCASVGPTIVPALTNPTGP